MKKSSQRVNVTQSNFTLIEMMVVLAIIAILLSLLFPSLGKARRLSRQAVCAQQLHQIGVAASLYSQDNNGKILSASHDTIGSSSSRDWQQVLAPYLGLNPDYGNSQDYKRYQGQGIYACPSSKVSNSKIWSNGGVGWNPEVGNVLQGSGGSGVVNSQFARIVKLTQVPKPSETTQAGDTVDYASSQALNATTIFAKPSEYSGIGDRHEGGVNALWVDGHVQHKRKAVLEAGRNGSIDYYFEVQK